MTIVSGLTPLALPGGLNAGKAPSPSETPLIDETPTSLKFAHSPGPHKGKKLAFKAKKRKAFA